MRFSFQERVFENAAPALNLSPGKGCASAMCLMAGGNAGIPASAQAQALAGRPRGRVGMIKKEQIQSHENGRLRTFH